MKDIYTIEAEANLFAIMLLIPEEFIMRDLEGIKAIDYEDDTQISKLAEKYQVSKQLMTIRLVSLGVLDL